MSRYRKFLVSVGAVFTVGGAALADGAVSSTEARDVGVAIASALLVWLLPNAQA